MKQIKRNFLITGATKGIGYAAAIKLQELGHHVIGIARRKSKFPGDLYEVDLADEVETNRIFKIINEKYEIDGVVNNVGIVHPQFLGEINLQDFHKVIDVNLRPALQAMEIFMKGMTDRKWGRVVNIASRAMLGKRGRSSYAASKAGLIGLTRTWGLELAPLGITVNAVAPGPIDTEMFRELHPYNSDYEKDLLKGIPMMRIGLPSEVAASIAFFLSEEAGFITGQTLYVDGGGSIGRALL